MVSASIVPTLKEIPTKNSLNIQAMPSPANELIILNALKNSRMKFDYLALINNTTLHDCFDGTNCQWRAQSNFAPKHGSKLITAYLWVQLWSIVPECLNLNPEILHQFYDRSKIMMGVLPTGAIPPHRNNDFPVCFEFTNITTTIIS